MNLMFYVTLALFQGRQPTHLMPSAKLKFGVFSGVCYVSFFLFLFFLLFFNATRRSTLPRITRPYQFSYSREKRKDQDGQRDSCKAFAVLGMTLSQEYFRDDIVSGVLPGRQCSY